MGPDERRGATRPWWGQLVAFGVLAGIAGYSWWASGQAAFSALDYLACALPIGAVLAGLLASGGGRRGAWLGVSPIQTARTRVLPVAVVVGAGVVLEAIGLIAGGRSRVVPTLSTVADQLTAGHVARFVAFYAWVLIGSTLAGSGRALRGKGRER